MRSLLPILNAFLLLLIAPILGIVLIVGFDGQEMLALDLSSAKLPVAPLEQQMNEMETAIHSIQQSLDSFSQQANSEKGDFEAQKAALDTLVAKSQKQTASLPYLGKLLYEQNFARAIGSGPTYTHHSETVDIKIYPVHRNQYRGYLAKVKAYKGNAFYVSTAKDGRGTRETTSGAAQRNKAILAINGGGFYPARDHGRTVYYPLGNTMVNGELIGSFMPSYSELFFAGFDPRGKLVGGYYESFDAFKQDQPHNGVSFLPILLKDGKKQEIPRSWQNRRQPRTIMGVLKNGDVLFLVIDGRQSNWSKGITLEEAQSFLQQIGCIDAYNLDGGGSTTMVYNNKIINRPSEGKERPVTTHIMVRP